MGGERWRRVAWAGVVLGAVALGVVSDAEEMLPVFVGLTPQVLAPWLLLGFGAGALVRRPAAAPLAGIGVLLLGNLGYLAVKLLAHGWFTVDGLVRERGAHWVALLALAGAVAGIAGWLSRCRSAPGRAVGWGLLVAGLLAEALAWWLVYPVGDARIVAAAGVALAAAAVVAGLRSVRRG